MPSVQTSKSIPKNSLSLFFWPEVFEICFQFSILNFSIYRWKIKEHRIGLPLGDRQFLKADKGISCPPSLMSLTSFISYPLSSQIPMKLKRISLIPTMFPYASLLSIKIWEKS